MWRFSIAMGWLIWLATITASAAINYVAGYQFGRETTESQIFAFLGVSADAWKAIGPIFVIALWRNGRRLLSCIAAAMWIVCFVFAVTAALGLAAHNRSALTDGREALRLSYQSKIEDLRALEQDRARLGTVQSPKEIETAISAIMARPVGTQGTVGSLSANCERDHWRTRGACLEVAETRRGQAAAIEVRRLEERIENVRQEIARLRERGGALSSDPQADLISRLRFGYVAREDVSLGIILLLAAMVELISAFAPVVLHEVASVRRATAATAGLVAVRRDPSRPQTGDRGKPSTAGGVGDLFEYLSMRILPEESGTVEQAQLYEDYQRWCRTRGLAVMGPDEFSFALDGIVRSDMAGRVWREGSRFQGFSLRDERV